MSRDTEARMDSVVTTPPKHTSPAQLAQVEGGAAGGGGDGHIAGTMNEALEPMATSAESAAKAATASAPRLTRHEAPVFAHFAAQGWVPAAFQKAVWRAWRRRESGLLVTPTGSGKTWAAIGGALMNGLADQCARLAAQAKAAANKPTRRKPKAPTRHVRVLWVTPMRALAADTQRALQASAQALGLDWLVALRTSDAGSRDRRLVQAGAAEVVVITPESLALLLTREEAAEHLAQLDGVVVDEWHDLLGSKRGVLLQLALARVRRLAPQAVVWGLSATLGNVEEARDVLLPQGGTIVRTRKTRKLTLRTLVPKTMARFPWAGHLGLSQLDAVMVRVAQVGTCIVFCNTRAQAELWHQALSAIWQLGADALALHHGSLDAQQREAVEQGLRDGRLRCVVATASLELGVDFPQVDAVIQLGSPKGMNRLLQRAGRARHQPGLDGEVLCVPTHALELAEFAAARRAIASGQLESPTPLRLSLDVLAQHCVSMALAGGFAADELLAEVRSTHAFAELSDLQWRQVLDFVVQGGSALANYPDFHRVVRGDDGRYRVTSPRVAQLHRFNIGTIVGESGVQVRFLKGGRLGTVDEGFISRLKPGDHFQFAGRTLELVFIEGLEAHVRLSKKADGVVPRWQGNRLPLSGELGQAMLGVLGDAAAALAQSVTVIDATEAQTDQSMAPAALKPAPLPPELKALLPLLALQARHSRVPDAQTLLIEHIPAREGMQLFIYPFAGRQVHEGLAALCAMRWARLQPNTITYAVNDWGFTLRAQLSAPWNASVAQTLLSPENLPADLQASLNLPEMMRRQFREIARISGLVVSRRPSMGKLPSRQLQASSGLLFDVLMRHDMAHVMLGQARREVFSAQLDLAGLTATLARLAACDWALTEPPALTPLAFGLWAEGQRGEVSTEQWADRVRRMADKLQQATLR